MDCSGTFETIFNILKLSGLLGKLISKPIKKFTELVSSWRLWSRHFPFIHESWGTLGSEVGGFQDVN